MSTVRALVSGFVGMGGMPVEVQEGDDWPADHPLVEARPDLFSEPVAEPKRPPARGKAKAADE